MRLLHHSTIPPPQALYRHHRARVVLLGFLADSATMVSVDTSGVLALWPAAEADITGYGWFTPRATWQLAKGIRSFHVRWGPGAAVVGAVEVECDCRVARWLLVRCSKPW